jgi:hypothetical protein
VTDFPFQQEFLNQVDQHQADDRKNKIKCEVILSYEFDLQNRLNEMREVLDGHSSQTGQESYENAQQIYELLGAEVLVPPLEKLLPKSFYPWHEVKIHFGSNLSSKVTTSKNKNIYKAKKIRNKGSGFNSQFLSSIFKFNSLS